MGEQQVVTGVEFVRLGQAEIRTQQIGHGAVAEPFAMQPPLAARFNPPIGTRTCRTWSQRVRFRLAGKRSAQNRSSCRSRHNCPANQQAPHCRGRCKRSSDSRARTAEELPATASQRSGGNKASVWEPPASASITSTALRQVSAWDELISPKYRTCLCTTRPPSRRLFSTTLQYRCVLPFFRRSIRRKNMTTQVKS